MTYLETKHLLEYFKEAVENATNRLKVDISANTEFYLVDLLSRYTDVKALSDQAIENKTQTFAELYLKSQGETPRTACTDLKIYRRHYPLPDRLFLGQF